MFIPLSPHPAILISDLPPPTPTTSNNHLKRPKQNDKSRPPNRLPAIKHPQCAEACNNPPFPRLRGPRHPPKIPTKPMALTRPTLRPILHPLHRPPPLKNPPPNPKPNIRRPTPRNPRTKRHNRPHRRPRQHPYRTCLLRKNSKRLWPRSNSYLR